MVKGERKKKVSYFDIKNDPKKVKKIKNKGKFIVNQDSNRRLAWRMYYDACNQTIKAYDQLREISDLIKKNEQEWTKVMPEHLKKQLVEMAAKSDCPICVEALGTTGQDGTFDGSKIKTTKCGHFFHIDCLKEWFKTAHTCPTCRAELTE